MSDYFDPLMYHGYAPAGKVGTCLTKPLETLADLAVAYTPGVSSPCSAIAGVPERVYDYTGKGNLVGMITNGTAVLGMGDVGALAAKPVMEGKAMLLKRLAGVNCFDVEVKERDPMGLARVVEAIAPTFGAIHLEDIKAPGCFEVERVLTERLAIPVMHDDQHGSAVTVVAGLANALRLVGKSWEGIRVVMHGAGAGAVATADLLVQMGVRKSEIVMFDSKGVVHVRRADLPGYKVRFATERAVGSLEEAMEGADVFVGFSVGNVLRPVHVMGMGARPVIFALANPTPEIDPVLVRSKRPDAIIGTGRSDFPNQINNAGAFPYVLRALLDVRARRLTQGMKRAVVESLAALGRGVSGWEEAGTVDGEQLLPNVMDPRLLTVVAPAVAKAAMQDGVAGKPVEDWDEYKKYLEGLVQQGG